MENAMAGAGGRGQVGEGRWAGAEGGGGAAK